MRCSELRIDCGKINAFYAKVNVNKIERFFFQESFIQIENKFKIRGVFNVLLRALRKIF